ncbi:MAG: protocatechuate 3,4-dioxygenase [Pseudomonadota bacterium]
MTRSRRLSRRAALAAGVGVGTSLLAQTKAIAALTATPRQTPGPFYPKRFPLDGDADLVQIAGRPEQAVGEILHVYGQVLDQAGQPMSGLTVEIWQCDAFAHYHHQGALDARADPNFQGWGRVQLGDDGAYRFRTIRPVPYPGRTPHIHFAVSGPGIKPLITQMYIEGEPDNRRDGPLNRVRDPEARARLIVPLYGAPELEPGALSGRFDIVLDDKLVEG